MGVAYSVHTTRIRSRECVKSCQLRYSITEDSNTHDRFAVALSAPGVGVIGHVPREFSRVVRHFAPQRDTYLQSIWEKTTWQRLGSAVSLKPVRAVPLSINPISRHFLRSEAHALN